MYGGYIGEHNWVNPNTKLKFGTPELDIRYYTHSRQFPRFMIKHIVRYLLNTLPI